MASPEDEQQQQHWRSAQSLVVGLDLVEAAQAQLRLLAAVHSHAPALYQGPSLQHAIRRYESCWLPLLAHHGVSCNGLHLVPPLDCAWIWHCHRLNPVQYVKDCETHYGMLLDSQCAFTDKNIEAIAHTRQLWDARFPGEEYNINLDEPRKEAVDYNKRITYDLQAAVERQSSFFYQVSRPYMGNESFLKGSLERYKGFLYLLKLCGLRAFLVPTYDIDLMWHSHQDSPRVYRQDTIKLFGKVLNHDDMDSDRSEGKKLDTGFNTTRVLWQTTFGTSYERAGAMYRGEQPASFFQTAPCIWAHGLAPFAEKQTGQVHQPIRGMPYVHTRETMQVYITVHTAWNLHMSQSSTLAVELLFQDKCKSLKMATSWYEGAQNPKWNHLWAFQCEKGTKGIRLELRSKRMSCFNLKTTSRLIGWVDVSWESLITSPMLSWDGWLPLQMTSKCGVDQKPTSLKISASITPPVMAPSLFWIKHPTMDRKEGCLSRCLYDHTHKKCAVIKIRGSYIGKTFHPLLVEVCPYGYTDREKALGEILGAAKLLDHDNKEPAMGTAWSLLDDAMRLTILKDTMTASGDRQPNVHLEASSHNLVRLLHGRRLEYEVVGGNQADEEGFFTLVRYTPDAGFGRATALFNWKLGLMEVAPEENGVLALLLCTILAVSFNSTGESWKKMRRDTKSSDEWGSVMLTGHHCARAQCLPCFAPWYSMSSVCWIDHRAGGVAAVAPCIKKVGSGCGGCGAGGCGGCGSGAGANGSIGRTSRGAKCGGCGSGCGGCGGGRGNSLTDVVKSNLGAAGCGGCGAGGCMNGVKEGASHVQALGIKDVEAVVPMDVNNAGGCGGGGCGSGCGGGCGGGMNK